MAEFAKTQCPYCGVGCGLEVLPPALPGKAINRDADGTPIWQARGDRAHPSSLGKVCVKGATVGDALDRDRLLYPMVRESLDQDFRRISWDEAYGLIVEKIQGAIATKGPDSICMYGSGQFQTEDYYMAQKLIKGCIGTKNFDANSRLCMSSAVSGYLQSFGSDGPPPCYADLDETDCAFLIGTNTADCHPIVFNRLMVHLKKTKGSLIVVDPRRTKTAEKATLHLPIKPGSDMMLLNGIAHLLLKWGKLDQAYIESCTEGFAAYAEVVQHYPPEVVAEACGISPQHLAAAARLWAKSDRVLSLWSMGVNQSTEGTAKCRAIINLHLLTGNLGRTGTGPFSLTGQPNAMGGREAGGLAHLLPGYRSVANPEHRAAVEAVWKRPAGSIRPEPGLTAWEMILALERGDVAVYWVAATNPVVSLPDLERTKQALEKSPFTICQDAYFPTETTEYAHLVLPAAQWGEKTGVMTNSERVVTLCQRFKRARGQAKADWEIFAEVGRRLGFEAQFDADATSADVFAEFVTLTAGRLCEMTGLSHVRLAGGPIQWPMPAQATAATAVDRFDKRLYSDGQFLTPSGRAQFSALHHRGLAEPPDPDYPFVLTTGRLYGHWHTLTRTGRIEKLNKMHPGAFLEIHPRDAADLGFEAQEMIEVRSRRGSIRLPLLITKAIAPGTVFVPMHWGFLWADGMEANALTHPEACPASKQPELKACAVALAKILPEAGAIAPVRESLLTRLGKGVRAAVGAS
jgi:ferredoxin-nitrate reductase